MLVMLVGWLVGRWLVVYLKHILLIYFFYTRVYGIGKKIMEKRSFWLVVGRKTLYLKIYF
jgi:hypothetical protein